jgi:hypothetical protein
MPPASTTTITAASQRARATSGNWPIERRDGNAME